MLSTLSPAAEFRLARLVRLALRGVVQTPHGSDVPRQATALAAARMVSLALPFLSRDDRGAMAVSVRTEGSHLDGRNVGDWVMEMRTLPDFHRRIERQASWRDARNADAYGALFSDNARQAGREEIDFVSEHLSLFLVRAAVESGRLAGEVVVRDAHGPLLILRIRRVGPLARMAAAARRLLQRLGLGERMLLQAHYPGRRR
jgi:hypothetical protein